MGVEPTWQLIPFIGGFHYQGPRGRVQKEKVVLFGWYKVFLLRMFRHRRDGSGVCHNALTGSRMASMNGKATFEEPATDYTSRRLFVVSWTTSALLYPSSRPLTLIRLIILVVILWRGRTCCHHCLIWRIGGGGYDWLRGLHHSLFIGQDQRGFFLGLSTGVWVGGLAMQCWACPTLQGHRV